MRISSHFRSLIGSLRAAGSEPARAESADAEIELPLRAELFSAEQLEEHGAALARFHRVREGRGNDRLLARLDGNERVLVGTCQLLTEAIRDGRRVTPASEWLLDNYYLVDEHVRIARRHFPKRYSGQLPLLDNGASKGLPRIYDIALSAISHGDGRLDIDNLQGFVAAYQRVAPLSIGELWAIPIMLRLALIENLRRVATRITVDRHHRDLAVRWSSAMADIAARDPKSLILVVADMARSEPPVSGSFVAEISQRLHAEVGSAALPLSWLEQRLSEAGVTTDQLVQAENQQQAAEQISVSNSIGSLRLLLAADWKEFVERLSATERLLATDPAGVYATMDFDTRDRYRHVVERLARRVHVAEEDVAAAAIALAAAADPADPVQRHVGHFLIGKGRAELGATYGVRTRSLHFDVGAYFALVVVIAAAFAVGPLLALRDALGLSVLAWMAGVLVVLASSQLALVVVNWLATFASEPAALPKLDFTEGIPEHATTVIAVPTLLGSLAAVAAELEALEIRYLANREPNLHFVLLGDFPDAPTETLEGDAAIIAAARAGIERLNELHAEGTASRFVLLQRGRVWTAGEGAWIGYERKRGKLAALNRLILEGDTAPFLAIAGDVDALRGARYVITLDADTQLPHDAARQLVATMEHPLNRPRVDERTRSVVEGHAILQPRVGTIFASGGVSRYAQWFSGTPGLDPYTKAVSDVYQDLFDEGSFTGKGIYDVATFERVLAGRLPADRILSHDLLEGCYARAGLVSDVLLFEGYPQGYAVDMQRRHRWTRGDWQIARWILPRVPLEDGRTEANPLGALSRWKIFDNLRRSLVAPALFVLLVLGWTVLGSPLYWTAFVLQVLWLPTFVEALFTAVRKPAEAAWPAHVRHAVSGALRGLGQSLFTLACLPHEAWIAVNAIARTTWRLLVSRRRLLEWLPSSLAERRARRDFAGTLRRIADAPLAAIGVGAALVVAWPSALPWAAPILVAWLAAPLLVWRVSVVAAPRGSSLDAASIAFVRDAARRTWHFFETFVGAEDHALPPDNFQEHPGAVVAHRTSPTNIGLSLLANLAACDLGYLSVRGLLERTEATFDTLDRLERHRGHFYNWYDTRTLGVLAPRYVSMVDSGNFAGHLMTLRQGLLALDALDGSRHVAGLRDTALALRRAAGDSDTLALRDFMALASEPRESTPTAVVDRVQRLAELAQAVAESPPPGEATGEWATRLLAQAQAALEELRAFADASAGIEATRVGAWMQRAAALAARAAAFAALDYEFLYDRERSLFHIGFNVDDHRLGAGYYDLLASEARLGVFVAIAQGRVPQESWFALGRLMIQAGAQPLLVSWSGSMFEYLMPNLVMPVYPQSLLDRTSEAAVERQIAYGDERDVPWGVSECGYLLTDAAQNYQYRAFGVPGLGLQRGLSQELVIAPYASALALVVAPVAAVANLVRMATAGFLAEHGFYEAVDYTAARLPPGQRCAIVRSFMAHHQGMSLLAFAHVLDGARMQRRFASDPEVQSALLLLQERMPRARGQAASHPKLVDVRSASDAPAVPLRVFTRPDPRTPAVQLLSNGRYHVMLTASGGGSSRWQKLAVTRWREDPTRDPWGTFCYLRDDEDGQPWSTAYQPTLQGDEGYEAIFTESRVEFRRRRKHWEVHTEIVVSPEDDVELRRTRITNRSSTARIIEVTSYAEVVLAPAIADSLHPAFGKLFVETEIVDGRHAIVCTRRTRDAAESLPALVHLANVHDGERLQVSYETDRARFLGRGRTPQSPQAMDAAGALSGSAGAVLDPIVAIRHRIRVAAHATAVVDIVTGVGRDRAHCLQLADTYHDRRLADRAIDLAWTHSRVTLRQINITEVDAQLYARLAGHLLYSDASQRADAATLLRNRRGQPALWAYAISGDLPIVIVRIGDAAHLELAREAVKAHAYWRLKGLAADLVIWNEERGGYRQELHDALMATILSNVDAAVLERPAGIFLRSAEQIPQEDRVLLLAVARVVLTDTHGSLAEHLQRRDAVRAALPALVVAEPSPAQAPVLVPPTRRPELLLDNGIGGFSADGREYVIVTEPGQGTPTPWSNVLANPNFGSIVSESGSGYTWRENAHEYRLTPWHNDPVSDTGGEAFYVRDERSGRFWSPTALPAGGAGSWTTRHGFGTSTFEHEEDGIATELRMYVAPDADVKFFVLRVRNGSGRTRALSVTGYIEWILGDLAEKTAQHVVTELDPRSGALLGRNAFHPEFGEWVSFFDVDEPERTLTGDRREFIGRNGNLARPAAMKAARLSGRVGAALDPCAAIQIPFELGDGQSRDVIFRLGSAASADEASALVLRLRRPGSARAALEATRAQWTRLLGAIEVETPDESLNALANGWLLYQVIACRMWGRSGYYQSGGAFGFRDQLQDAMALVHAAPEMLRAQLLLCASRQFKEGDVQHWWHPPAGRGVRTRCSDDYLWLPMATLRYVDSTADHAVLDETASFLDGRALNAGEESYYDLPLHWNEPATLYEHCVRAIRHGLRMGEHGLPLIGSGDWNDGLSNVGLHGRGESVWLGFFLHRILVDFAPLAQARGDEAFAATCRDEAARLHANLEAHAWDGAWYRRAYFDDGTPLGSAANTECRIDSIAQSWSVLSGVAPPARAKSALDALATHLVRPEARLIQLLDPPFDGHFRDPGYIRGYVPGVRENGGQYTHAAIWAAMAFVEAGRAGEAWQLFDMINPSRHATTPDEVAVYRVEPYVAAADVYAVAPHVGRGGWTWYTGSAGWFYRLIIESLLGIRREGDRLRVTPKLPAHWPGFRFRYRFGASVHHIDVIADADATEPPHGHFIALVDDGEQHAHTLRVRPCNEAERRSAGVKNPRTSAS